MLNILNITSVLDVERAKVQLRYPLLKYFSVHLQPGACTCMYCVNQAVVCELSCAQKGEEKFHQTIGQDILQYMHGNEIKH